MKYVAAYLLSAMGGESSPSNKDISKILGSVGIDADSERISSLLSAIEGKNIEEIIASGLSKLASAPCASGAAPASSSSAAAPAAAAKKEEKKEEVKEESDDEPSFDLFG